jgi:hypothetical protein
MNGSTIDTSRNSLNLVIYTIISEKNNETNNFERKII